MKIWKNHSREVMWKLKKRFFNLKYELRIRNDILNWDNFVPQKRGKIGLN